MKITFFSDTHNAHKFVDIPSDSDMVIFTGDMCGHGNIKECKSFLRWFSELPNKYKVMISGNHDIYMDKSHYKNNGRDYNPKDIIPQNIIYLENETVTIEDIKIFGSPVTPWFYDWAFNVNRGEDILEYWNKIEPDTDIIITHGPPQGILDRCMDGSEVGCIDLKNKIDEIKPSIVAFGHIHEAYGIKDIDDVKYINSSIMTVRYQPLNDPITIDYEKSIK